MNNQTDLANEYIHNRMTIAPQNISALEASLQALESSISQIEDKDKRNAAYNEVNLALLAKRDQLRKEFYIDPDATARSQIKQMASRPEGRQLLNAFIFINKGMPEYVRKNFRQSGNYDYISDEDFLHAGIYGAKGKVLTSRRGASVDEDSGVVGGVIAAAMKFDTSRETKFASFLNTYVQSAVKNLIDAASHTHSHEIPWSTLETDDNAWLDRHLGRDENLTTALLGQELKERLHQELGKLKPDQQQVMSLILQDYETPEIAQAIGKTEEEISIIKKAAMYQLRSMRKFPDLRSLIEPRGTPQSRG